MQVLRAGAACSSGRQRRANHKHGISVLASCTRTARTCAQHALAQRRLRAYVLQKQFKPDIGVDRSETLENGGRVVFSVGAMEM